MKMTSRYAYSSPPFFLLLSVVIKQTIKLCVFLQSDDDMNTTTSDVDSQPATPLSQASDIYDDPSCPIYSKDGLFKVPRARNDSTTSQTEQDYIIAKRTRSKISLAETPIEAIESTFKAPDAPLDMYRYDIDDQDWTDFLTGLAMPMSKTKSLFPIVKTQF